MIALGIRYLTKYAVATDLFSQQAEWPPHPGRVFMAMAAAHFESGSDPEERTALEWVEAVSAPALQASGADERSLVRAYVPVNDVCGSITTRPRQDRAFPRTRPHDDYVYVIWADTPRPGTRAALERLCRKVTRLGHSMSAVEMWVVPEGQEPEANWLPEPEYGDTRLRVPSPGTLRSLEAAFNAAAIQEFEALCDALALAKGREKARLKSDLQARFPDGRPESRRPRMTAWSGYLLVKPNGAGQTIADGPFDENFVVLARTAGPALGLESTLQLTGALRNCAMKAVGAAVPEWISGHDAAGKPSLRIHAAFFPLPYVGFDHADGHILGLGIAVPRGLADEELRRGLGALFFDPESGEERRIRIYCSGWAWELEREIRERPPLSLQRLNWTHASRVWTSVTPVVLHHHPKKREGDIERIVREAFVSALLPQPEAVFIRSVSAVKGAGHVMGMPPFTEGGADLCRFHTHVVARFAQPVRGPVLVGRGRFRGYGLFRPLPQREASAWTS